MGDYHPPQPTTFLHTPATSKAAIMGSSLQTQRRGSVSLSEPVERMIEQICIEKQQPPPDHYARQRLFDIGEEKAYEIVRRIYYSEEAIRTTLSRYITWFTDSPQSPFRQSSSTPSPRTPPPQLHASSSPPKRALHFPPPPPTCFSQCDESPCSPMSKLNMSSPLPHPESARPSQTTHKSMFCCEPGVEESTSTHDMGYHFKVLNEISYQLTVLSQLEFRKFFLLYSYIGRSKLEEVITTENANKILEMKNLPMGVYESCIWDMCGKQLCAPSDRIEVINWDSGKTHFYYCHVYEDGSYCFKGPYLKTIRTHLQRALGDDNVLIVRFVDDGKCNSDRIIEDGIIVGLRRYRFFAFKDECKDAKKKKKGLEKNKTPLSAFPKCYFVRFDSIATSGTDEPYLLSSLEVNEARRLFMDVNSISSMAKYIARFSLILSKTIKLPVDLSSVVIDDTIQDIECRDGNNRPIKDDNGEPLIHTDGTGFISEDLALKCPQDFGRAEYIKDKDFQKFHNFVGFVDAPFDVRGTEARNRDPPLLMQCRLFSQGLAVKGTLLVNKKLKAGTIQIRPSMIKVQKDREGPIGQTFDSLEIVAVSHRPRRCHLSKYLIALLSYGGVPRTFFVDLMTSVLEETNAVFTDKRAAFKVALHQEGFYDAGGALRLLLAGIPLNEPHLQKRLSELANNERTLLKEGKIPISESFYLMGTADPTGLLKENEVCVVLDNGQVSGKVLLYRNPGLHFGDVHVLEAVYVPALEDIIGNAKYGIFFSTKGRRSVASEIANGDFDGDMYWVSRNPQLLKYFRASPPWTRVYPSPRAERKNPNEYSAEQLEHELFRHFLKKPSYNMAVAADSWLAFIDRLLILGDDNAKEKDALKENMLKLIDIYYDALDAPKRGTKVIVPEELKAERFPHYMGKDGSYRSTSVLGDIYDRAEAFQSEQRCIAIEKLPCFDVEVPQNYLSSWRGRYNEYRKEMNVALQKDDESRNDAADDVIKKYKRLLYEAAEFEESKKDVQEIHKEALALYQVTYDYAISTKDAGKCGFAWKAAGSALLSYFATGRNERLVPVSPSALRELFS
ncbi:probable RNA-dependent RNA polymerase 5 isoform X1 [Coffea arabica]|uniref:RNA-dependent RNA polymerase n=2 Tax=Coffea arabica TaxID=13443 RepID=A0A6P6SGD2_COFAR